MPEVNHIQIGGTTYDLRTEASNLNPGATIDGVTFTGETNIIHYGVCATAADVAAKVVSVDGFALAAGARAEVKFSNANIAANSTLNVSSMGAKPIRINGGWNAGDVIEFVYDGTNWVATGGNSVEGTFTVGNLPALTAKGLLADSGLESSLIAGTYPGILNALAYAGASIPATVTEGVVYTAAYLNGTTAEGYNTYAFPVVAGTTYYLTATIPTGVNYRPALFYGPANEYVGQIPKDGTIYSNYAITAPTGATLMRVSASGAVTAPVLNGLSVYPENIPDKIKSVELLTDGATIHMDDFSVTMQKHGNNNLMDLYKIYKSDGTLIYTGGSDWQGPYVVDAINNADGDAIAAGRDYTGGNHPYGPGAEGTATGATLSFNVFADGKAVAPGGSAGWVDCVVVEWENEVQAWNTKKADGTGRAVLHEKPRWTFHRDGTVEVQNTILATEDILIYNYYGIQMQAAWLSGGYFLPSVSREFKTVDELNALCGGYAHGLSTVGYNANIAICMGYDPFSDLGSGDGLKDWASGRIHMSNTKMYTKMCDEMSLLQGESASYRGYYMFLLPENVEGFVSSDEYAQIVKDAVAGNLPKLKVNGDLEDSGIPADNVALQDGYYDGLTAGAAESLTGRGDGIPARFTFRPSGGDADVADGTATIASLCGNTLFWNQLAPAASSASNWAGYGGTISAEDDVISLTVTSATANPVAIAAQASKSPRIFAGRKYYMTADLLLPRASASASLRLGTSSGVNYIVNGVEVPADKWTTISGAFTADTDVSNARSVTVVAGGLEAGFQLDDVLQFRNVMVFDLTAMFGVGNEPTEAVFQMLFPLCYYTTQQSPTPLHYNGTGIQTVGFNQWDEVWETGSINSTTGQNVGAADTFRSKNFIPVFPGMEYHIEYKSGIAGTSAVFQRWYDADKNYLGNADANGKYSSLISGNRTAPSGAHYFRFAVSGSSSYAGNGDITINMSWSGYRDGETEAYWTQTRELPVSTYFPTGMKSAGAVFDELRSGKAIQRVDSVDAGSLTWGYSTTYSNPLFYATVSGSVDSATLAGYTKAPGGYNYMPDKTYIFNAANSRLTIRDDAYPDAASFGAAISGTDIFYGMETPVETPIATALNLSYRVSDFGTERSLPDNNAVPTTSPMSAKIVYGLNVQDTVRRLPINYISKDSFDNLAAELSDTLGVGITATYNKTTAAYDFTVEDNAPLRIVPVPASATSGGTAGNIAFNTNYLYVCITSGVDGEARWKQVALSAMS